MRHTGSHCTDSRNENDGGWGTFMENAEVLYVTLFTPGLSNMALSEGYMVYSVDHGALRYGIME